MDLVIQIYSDNVDGPGGEESCTFCPIVMPAHCRTKYIEHGAFSVTFVQDQSFSGKALVFDLEDAVAAAKEGYPRIRALVQDTLEVAIGSVFCHLESNGSK